MYTWDTVDTVLLEYSIPCMDNLYGEVLIMFRYLVVLSVFVGYEDREKRPRGEHACAAVGETDGRQRA